VHLPARYVSEETVLSGSVANLSRTALFLQSEFLDDPGHDVEVTFSLPGEAEPVAVRGRVIRVNDGPLCPGMAIRFTAVPNAARHRLRRFLATRSARRLDPPPA
jgi:PilZ domain